MTKRDHPEEIRRHLLAQTRRLPTSFLRRLGKTSFAFLKGARLARKLGDRGAGQPQDDLDLEKVGALVRSLGELKGVAMKMGQILSYIDIAIPEELRAALAVLQTHAPPMAFDRLRDIVLGDLGERGKELLRHLVPEPLAAASIGQVHRALLPDGTAVAVKVLYPEVEQAIRSDFGPAAFGSKLASLFFPGARIGAVVEEARARFLEECDYRHEARMQMRFARLFHGHPLILVPEVHLEYSSVRVLTTTLAVGLRFDEFLASEPAQEVRDRLGCALFDFYLGTLFRHGLYNCDPHPGNYLFLPDGRMAMLDYGCTREFDPAFVAKLAALARAVHADDRQALHRAFLDLGMVSGNRAYDFDTARALVRSFHGPMLRDEFMAIALGEALQMKDVYQGKLKLLKLALPGEFLFLIRIRFGLLSVLARMGARANWYQLERGLVAERPGAQG